MVLDVLKPHQPSIIEMGKLVGELDGVRSVSIILREVDADTETVVLSVEGISIDYDAVLDVIEQCSASVHSVDEVSVERAS
jgi:hypothetical protein